EDGIVMAGIKAVEAMVPAEVGLAIADATGIGTNRRDPRGPSDLEVPVLVARALETGSPIACMLICSMHPTVLHEDSTLVSGDFPGMARQYLKKSILGSSCPVVYHTGPEGNQSPRHVTKGNTFAEAKRLGEILGRAVETAIGSISFRRELALSCAWRLVDLPKKAFPEPAAAERRLDEVLVRFEGLKAEGAPATEIRTAECDWFGAEETLTLARSYGHPDIEPYYQACLPAEIQAFGIGEWTFVGWPGEVFIEYALELKSRHPSTYIANLANGELQGYIVTEGAAREGGYEASNAMFDYRSGKILVDSTSELLNGRSRG
ncbi:MAG TPA: hypothetical protein VMW69_02305, partial [Spirochaetia bacterium]|nr:hypothetical protein [Spirochaetia bacterium]